MTLSRPTPDQFRSAVGSFITGVTVVAAERQDGTLWGLTANSFTSVSLDPPLISVCIGTHAGSYDTFARAELFGVSILSQEQERIAVRFASPISNKFDGVVLKSGTSSPVLDGSAAWLECSTYRRISLGDHMVLVGSVEQCGVSGVPPLGYLNRGFFSLSSSPEISALTQRRMTAAWIVETDDAILLARGTAGDDWQLPTAIVPLGRSTSDDIRRAGGQAIGGEIMLQALYSVFDVPEDDTTWFVYRARLQHWSSASLSEEVEVVRLSEVPWIRLSPRTEPVLRRFVRERETDRFGIYMGIGDGRVALIDSIADWDPRNRE